MIEVRRINKRGQITIPKKIREKAGIKEGDYVEISVENGKIIIRKVEIKPSA